MKSIAFWLKFSVFSFCIVSVLGVLMRYKMAYSFPFLDQKHTQEAHSHFAFYGWVALCIYTLLVNMLQKVLPRKAIQKYFYLILLNALAAFMMIPLFLWKGYFAGSILLSAMALLVSFVFFGFVVKDLRNVQHIAKPWIVAGLFFAVLSSLGVFSLAYMKGGLPNQNWYLASTYYYLHFQYNGFFLFSCIGFLMTNLERYGAAISNKENRLTFWFLFFGCIMGYGLSVLWLDLPRWIFMLIVIGSVLQTIGAIRIVRLVYKNWHLIKAKSSPLQRWVLPYVGTAFMVKILLQLGSTIPEVAQFAFGFRTIVVAYLHLVLLMCISVFLVGQVLESGFFQHSKKVNFSFASLMLCIFLNEFILGLMGVFSIRYVAVPYSSELLLGVSVLMMLSLLMLWKSLRYAKSAS